MIHKTKILYLLATALLLCSFIVNTTCDLVKSNLDVVLKQTNKAVIAKDINTIKYHTYKAIKIVQKLEKQLEDCNCDDATQDVNQGLNLLKEVTKANSFETAKTLIKEAEDCINSSIVAISNFSRKNKNTSEYSNNELYAAVDSILIPFEKSMKKMVVDTENCKEAYKLAKEIYQKNELKLMDTSLSESKKYYHLRSKEIAKQTIAKLEDCATRDN
ncbi:hypothetical protein [Cellulophaga fucicola]|uniref:hypothetical protein n=1 Tax=Cellulophaga fucicola TaxID=76595 RepID=UPI003EBD5E01